MDVLRDPDALRSLGRGEFHERSRHALAAESARRTLRHLELIRRSDRDDLSTPAELINRWIELIRRGSPATARFLTDPLLSIWAAQVVRNERDGSGPEGIARLIAPEIATSQPMALTLDAVPRTLEVPRCGGSLHWPSHAGSISIRLADGELVVESSSSTATFQAGRTGHPPRLSGGVRWEPAVRLHAGSGRATLDVLLAQHDPVAAAIGPASMVELDPRLRAQWLTAFQRAWTLITHRHDAYLPGIVACAHVLVPQGCEDPTRHVSSTHADGFGAIGLSYTEDVATFAVALIHETQHLKLSALLDAVKLHDADATARYYAGWRADPRPFQALLHGVYAFSAVTEFWRVEYLAARDPVVRRRYCLEFARWAAQTSASLRELIEADVVTPSGRAFLAGIEDIAERWDEPIESAVRTAVGDVVAEHRINWELRRRSSTLGIETGLRHAWQVRLIGTDRVPAVPPTHPHPVDLALAADDPHAALALCTAAVRDEPGDPANWFRLSRGYAHAGMPAESASVQTLLIDSATAAPAPEWTATLIAQLPPAGARPENVNVLANDHGAEQN